MITSQHNPFSHGQVDSAQPPSGPENLMTPQSNEIPANHGFQHGLGYNYGSIGNDNMPSPHPSPSRMRQQNTPVHMHNQPPPIVLNQPPSINSYNSNSVPTTPTTQTPAEPLHSPHHLSVNNVNHFGSMNGHQQSHPCTPTRPVNTFSFSPHQVQQYHQQQQEQSLSEVRSLPTTPTENQSSPSTPAIGYVNSGIHYSNVYHHPAGLQHGPRSLPATPADHNGMPYPVHHQATPFNDPNPSPYSVASQSSPYDLHQPASHLQNQQQSGSNYQTNHDHRQQLHSTGTYEDQDMSETYQESTNQNEADIDEYDISQIDVQNLMEHIQSASGQQQQQLPLMESHQSFYPQTEPITPTTPAAAPTPFHSFPIPNKFQAHNFRSNVIHQNQDTQERQGFPLSVGKSMSQFMNTQQQHVDHHQMLQVQSVSHRQDVTNTVHHDPDAATFQVPSLVSRNLPVVSSMDSKHNALNPPAMPATRVTNMATLNYGSMSYPTEFRNELRSSTPPNLVVNLSPMTSRPASTTVMTSSSVTITSDDGLREAVPRKLGNPAVVLEEDMDDEVFPPNGTNSHCNSNSKRNQPLKAYLKGGTSEAKFYPSEKSFGNPSNEVKNVANLKRSHETGGVIVHGTDQSIRQQNPVSELLQKTAQLLEEGFSENKKPPEINRVEIRSPKRMRHKPEPIYIPPQVNAFGVSNHFSSRTSRSPRIRDGKGSQIPVTHNVFTKLNFPQGSLDLTSKISPPPYTPPPMLSPVRTSFGYYYHINMSSSGTPKIPLAPSFTNVSCITRKLPVFTMARDGQSKPEIVDHFKDHVKTPMTAYEPFPEFAASFDSERSSEGDILPHVNVGPNYQARIPAFIPDRQSAKEKYRYEKADMVWDPSIIGGSLLNEEEIVSFLEVACSLCVPGAGRNQEYAHHLLFRAKGDMHEALNLLLLPCPKIEKSDPLFGYHYSETDVWSTEDIVAYHQALIKCDKDFLSISKEVSLIFYQFLVSHSFDSQPVNICRFEAKQ